MGVKVREKPAGSGIWWVFVNHKGKRRSKKIGKDKKAARDFAKKFEARLVLGEFGFLESDESPTFKAYADRWLNTVVPATCKESTQYDYKAILKNHVLSKFGAKPVSSIKRYDVKVFLMNMYKNGKAQSTVTHVKNVLGGVFNLAVDDEVITQNPAHRLGKIFGKKEVEKISMIDPLNREELALFLETINKHYPLYYPFALTLARTGMRLGEAIGLQWGDIDFNSRFIHVQRSLSKGKISTPKNGKGRHVDMSLQLTETLWRLKHEREREMKSKMPEWVFLDENSVSPNETHWRRDIFNKTLEKAELRHVRVHDLRHTYASLLLQAGESMAYIRDQLGHHSIKVTVDIYGHLVPGGNKEAVDRLDDNTENAPHPHPQKKTRAQAHSLNPCFYFGSP